MLGLASAGSIGKVDPVDLDKPISTWVLSFKGLWRLQALARWCAPVTKQTWFPSFPAAGDVSGTLSALAPDSSCAGRERTVGPSSW